MITVKEIERAVEQLLPKDFARLSAWMKKHKPNEKRSRNGNSADGGADWFDVYMACPHPFEMPPRKKLPPPGTDISDEEVECRDQELESGRVTAISHEELVRRVQQQRNR